MAQCGVAELGRSHLGKSRRWRRLRLLGCILACVGDLKMTWPSPLVVDDSTVIDHAYLDWPRKLRIFELCAGIGSGTRAMQMLSVPLKPSMVIDKLEILRPTLQRLHHGAEDGVVRVGNVVGDLCRLHPQDVPFTDLAIGGPPCQGNSSTGKKLGASDPRNAPFDHSIKILGQLAKRGLTVFLLENVVGIGREWQGRTSNLQRIRKLMHEEMPGFVIQDFEVNAKQFNCPQSRPRVLIIGVRMDVVWFGMGVQVPKTIPLTLPPQLHPPRFALHADIGDVVNWSLPNMKDPSQYTVNTWSNALKYGELIKQKVGQHQQQGKHIGKVAVADLSRSPDKVFGKWLRIDGLCQCLQTSTRYLMLYSLEDFDAPLEDRKLWRMMTKHEMFLLQGTPAEVADDFVFGKAVEVAGNAFPVQMIAGALANPLRWLHKSGVISATALDDEFAAHEFDKREQGFRHVLPCAMSYEVAQQGADVVAVGHVAASEVGAVAGGTVQTAGNAAGAPQGLTSPAITHQQDCDSALTLRERLAPWAASASSSAAPSHLVALPLLPSMPAGGEKVGWQVSVSVAVKRVGEHLAQTSLTKFFKASFKSDSC